MAGAAIGVALFLARRKKRGPGVKVPSFPDMHPEKGGKRKKIPVSTATAEMLSPASTPGHRLPQDFSEMNLDTEESEPLRRSPKATLRPLPPHLVGRVKPLSPEQVRELQRLGVLPPRGMSPRARSHGVMSPDRAPSLSPRANSPRVVVTRVTSPRPTSPRAPVPVAVRTPVARKAKAFY